MLKKKLNKTKQKATPQDSAALLGRKSLLPVQWQSKLGENLTKSETTRLWVQPAQAEMQLHKDKGNGQRLKKKNHTKGLQKFNRETVCEKLTFGEFDVNENIVSSRRRFILKSGYKKSRFLFFFIWRTSKVSLMCRPHDYLEQVSVSPSFIHWHWRGFFLLLPNKVAHLSLSRCWLQTIFIQKYSTWCCLLKK